jgi:hypothetical protein
MLGKTKPICAISARTRRSSATGFHVESNTYSRHANLTNHTLNSISIPTTPAMQRLKIAESAPTCMEGADLPSIPISPD